MGIAFEVLPEGTTAPADWKLVTGHLVWDVKMDFSQKARWVLHEYWMDTRPCCPMVIKCMDWLID